MASPTYRDLCAELLTVQEAMKMAKCGIVLIREATRSDDPVRGLPSIRLTDSRNGPVRIPRIALEAWLVKDQMLLGQIRQVLERARTRKRTSSPRKPRLAAAKRAA